MNNSNDSKKLEIDKKKKTTFHIYKNNKASSNTSIGKKYQKTKKIVKSSSSSSSSSSSKKYKKTTEKWTPSTEDYVDYGSAGGIIIDPWNNPEDPDRYNTFIIKQRSNSIWGLPKGHLEKNEEFEEAAMREVMEETGFDFSKLQEGVDYISVPVHKGRDLENSNIIPHRIKTHQIHIYIWMLLKPGHSLPKHGRDNREIQDCVWINTTRLRKLMEDKNPNFMCNRTINSKIIYQINQACHNGYKMLLENHSYFNSITDKAKSNTK